MPLHVDLRPNNFEDFAGNRSEVQSLKKVLSSDSRPHTYLFTGPRGCGKTTLARITASMVNCTDFNLKEMNCANQRKIEDARDIIQKCHTKGLHGGNKGFILDEFHLFGEGGDSSKNKPQNALLKVLEEPPEHCYFFLCSTDPGMILKTIRSRCMKIEVSTLNEKQMVNWLSKIPINDQIPVEVLQQIAKNSQGHPRDALTIMEKVIGLPERQMLRAAKQSVQIESQAIDLARGLIQGKSWKAISEILKGLDKEDPEGVRRLVIGYAGKVLLSTGDTQAYLVLDAFREPFYNTGMAGLILACYESLGLE